jgi:hypothetical protein
MTSRQRGSPAAAIIVAREDAMDDVQKMLEELETIRRVVEGPDDSWMDALSEEELRQLRERALLLADNLSRIQDQLLAFEEGMTPES